MGECRRESAVYWPPEWEAATMGEEEEGTVVDLAGSRRKNSISQPTRKADP